MKTIEFAGQEYNLDNISAEARKLISMLHEVESQLTVRKNLIEALKKARSSYFAELKQSILQEKAGIDLLDI